ncbi:MAG: hypothetical protein AB1805_02650 [Nitrospirota bacterium]
MLRSRGGERAKRGSYWNFGTGERVIATEGMILPGDRATTYYRAHPLVILLAAPLLGLVYAVFLPFIGIAAIVKMVTEKAVTGTARRVAGAAHFGWRPLEAYFGGRKAKKNDKEKKDGEGKAGQ